MKYIKIITISLLFIFISFTISFGEQTKPLPTPPNELLYGKVTPIHITVTPTPIIKNNIIKSNDKTVNVVVKPIIDNKKVPAKKVNGGILVREDVFNDLVTKSKLYEQVVIERDYYKNKAIEILSLNLEQTTIYEQRLKLKDEIISTKDAQMDLYKMNVENYKLIIEDKNNQLSKFKRNNFVKDVLTLGMAAYGISQINDDSSKAILGAAGLLNIYIK